VVREFARGEWWSVTFRFSDSVRNSNRRRGRVSV
jgi:hypothetical protein